jgi:lipopolysaccharide-induced tumor necrosis factor-alpha factor
MSNKWYARPVLFVADIDARAPSRFSLPLRHSPQGRPSFQQGVLPGAPPAVAPAPGVPAATHVGLACPYCGHQGPLLVQKQLSQGGWILFAVLLLLCFPLCWLPFVIDGCKDKTAKCAACGLKVA